MPLKVYLDPISEPCRAVMLLLETNKVKYEKVLLQLLKGESVRSAVVRVASEVHSHRRRSRVRHLFSDAIYKRTPDLGREGLVSFDCWYMCGVEGWNTVHSARHRYAASPRG